MRAYENRASRLRGRPSVCESHAESLPGVNSAPSTCTGATPAPRPRVPPRAPRPRRPRPARRPRPPRRRSRYPRPFPPNRPRTSTAKTRRRVSRRRRRDKSRVSRRRRSKRGVDVDDATRDESRVRRDGSKRSEGANSNSTIAAGGAPRTRTPRRASATHRREPDGVGSRAARKRKRRRRRTRIRTRVRSRDDRRFVERAHVRARVFARDETRQTEASVRVRVVRREDASFVRLAAAASSRDTARRRFQSRDATRPPGARVRPRRRPRRRPGRSCWARGRRRGSRASSPRRFDRGRWTPRSRTDDVAASRGARARDGGRDAFQSADAARVRRRTRRHVAFARRGSRGDVHRAKATLGSRRVLRAARRESLAVYHDGRTPRLGDDRRRVAARASTRGAFARAER